MILGSFHDTKHHYDENTFRLWRHCLALRTISQIQTQPKQNVRQYCAGEVAVCETNSIHCGKGTEGDVRTHIPAFLAQYTHGAPRDCELRKTKVPHVGSCPAVFVHKRHIWPCDFHWFICRFCEVIYTACVLILILTLMYLHRCYPSNCVGPVNWTSTTQCQGNQAH